MTPSRLLLILITLPLLTCRENKPVPPFSDTGITGEELRRHVRYLASDELGGRRAGTDGAGRAARYIAGEFQRYGLQPAGDDGGWTDSFEFTGGVRIGDGNSLSVIHPDGEMTGRSGKDYLPISFSSNATVDGNVVFAGYGIIAPEAGYNDYEGIDVSGKIVLILRYTPDGTSTYGVFAAYRALRYKMMTAREHGATGVLFVTGPETQPEDEIIVFRQDLTPTHSGIPAVSISRKVADVLFRGSDTTLQAAQANIDGEERGAPFLLPGVQVSMQTDLRTDSQVTKNVLGWLPGNDDQFKNEVIVIGAHYDHLGAGGMGSLASTSNSTATHYGADDNASGTAGLLELAQTFAARHKDLKRSLLFVAFAAEELGLLGSAHYVEHPFIPLTRTTTMVNLDMIGRLSNRRLTVGGTGTARMWEDVLNRQHQGTFDLEFDPSGLAPSDHASFYRSEIPVLFFYTGRHEDYHRPSDTP